MAFQKRLFTGPYDANGKLANETWPNGVQVTVGIGESGNPASLSYLQSGNALFLESARSSVHGQWLNRASTLSSQGYGYDASCRLTSVADTASGSCTTRVYSFDTATNRTGLTTYGPGTGGAYQNTTLSEATTWTFEAVDRASTSGLGFG